MQTFWNVTARLLEGSGQAAIVFAVTLAAALPLGLLIAFCSMSRFRPLRAVSRTLVWIIRGTPLMLQIIVVFYGPGLLWQVQGLDRMPAVLVAFIINYAGYFAEIYRSGLQSIPRGQYEAAEVLGYSRLQTFLYIVMPQVAKRILPAMGNEVITLVKDTSLAFAIGVGEMFSTAKALVASQVSMVPFAIAALIYWVFNFVVEMLLGAAETKLDYYHD